MFVMGKDELEGFAAKLAELLREVQGAHTLGDDTEADFDEEDVQGVVHGIDSNITELRTLLLGGGFNELDVDAAVEQVDELVTELDLSNDALLKAQAALEQVRGSTASDQFLEELAQVSLYFQRKPLVVKRDQARERDGREA